MKTYKYLVIVLLGLFIFSACAKEESFETGTVTGFATGSLKNLAGDCQDISIKGQYVRDSTLRDSSYVVVQVNFTTPGLYNITTDTENGFKFQDSGYMINTGLQSVKLKAVGKPLATQPTNFTVSFDTSFCIFTVNVTNTATRAAVYTLVSGTTCGNAQVQGTYQAGTALNTTNTVAMQVNVTTPGTYSISTTAVNGMTFSAQGTFSATGTQPVTLSAAGTPGVARTDSIPITAGSTTCKFGVVVNPAASGNVNTSTWSFTQGTKTYTGNLDSAKTSTLPTGGSVFVLYGSTAAKDSILTLSIQFPGATPVAGTYNTNIFALNSFSLDKKAGGSIFAANGTTTGANTAIVVTSYNALTKTIVGTFSGTAFNATNTVVPITAGTFRAVLQ